MKKSILILFVIVCTFFYKCSEDVIQDPPSNQNPTGKLFIKSNPSGARIFLLGTDTGINTPDTIHNLQTGTYDVFLTLQYYDTAFFLATIFENLTTTKEVNLVDGLPFVEISWDYSTAFGGDSVRFIINFNQDVLMDSIIVERPVDINGNYVIEKYQFNKLLFVWKDQFGNPIDYYIPPSGTSRQYYPRIQSLTYWFNIYGQKAYGAKAYFHFAFGQNF